MPIPLVKTNYVAEALQRLTQQFRGKPKIDALFTTEASAQVVVIEVLPSTTYTITIDGTPVDYVSGLNDTDIQIATGLKDAVNAEVSLDMFARQTEGIANIYLFAEVPGTDFIISVTSNLAFYRTSVIDQIQTLELVFDDVLRQRGLLDDGSGNQAEGEQLDGIGRIVGLSREPGQDDAEYRDLLFIQIVRNRSNGEPERLIQVLVALTSSTEVELVEYFPASVILTFNGTVTNPTRIFQIMDSLAAAGVRIGLVQADPDEPFAFAGGSGLGFGEGKFSQVIGS